MDTRDIISIIAILVGPVTAVCITLWWQRRKEKRDRQFQLFATLMANRRAALPSYEWANSLNLIDVVFADYPKIVALWHECYLLLQNQEPTQASGHKYLELLSEMARTLGFQRLQQTDIDKYYSPRVHGELLVAQAETQAEWLRVLKNTERFLVVKKDDQSTP